MTMHELQTELLEQLGSQFSLAVEGMLGERWPASLNGNSIPADSSKHLCWSQKLNISDAPVVQVAVDDPVWREIGKRALVSVGLEDPAESDIRATYLELLTQALSGLARFLTTRAGVEITLESGTETPLVGSRNAGNFQCLRLTSPTGFSADLFVHIEPVIVEALLRQEAAKEQRAAEAERAQAQQRAAAAAAGGGGSVPQAAPSSLEMLLDVEMPVSVSFGRTQLPLKEVIKLSTGSIIELNRTIAEPVEVIVNNCVIARGEVVVVEGNYGVRIHQIVSRSERLKTFD